MSGRDIPLSLILTFIRFHSWLPGYAMHLRENAVLIHLMAGPLHLGISAPCSWRYLLYLG